MNAEQFKKELEDNKEKNLSIYLKEHEETYGETLEEAINRILREKTRDIDLNEPFVLDLLSKTEKDEYEWRECNGLEYLRVYKSDSTFETKVSIEVVSIKRMFFGEKRIEEREFFYRPAVINQSISYGGLSEVVKEKVQSILTDKGFFVIEEHLGYGNNFMWELNYILDVYWNKENYEATQNQQNN